MEHHHGMIQGEKRIRQYNKKQQHAKMDLELIQSEHNMNDNGTLPPSNEIAELSETDFSTVESAEFYNFSTLPMISPLPTLPFAQTNQIQWKNKANLVGEKIINPSIHMCDECANPILVYGRMIPCKHVFCFECANKSQTECLRCKEEIFKIEKCKLGTVFICKTETCRRTYLSQRDLEAHIKHRHVVKRKV